MNQWKGENPRSCLLGGGWVSERPRALAGEEKGPAEKTTANGLDLAGLKVFRLSRNNKCPRVRRVFNGMDPKSCGHLYTFLRENGSWVDKESFLEVLIGPALGDDFLVC